MRTLIPLLASALALAGPARAENLPVFSTGVDDAGNLLDAGAVDPHYRIATVAERVGGGGPEPVALPSAGAVYAVDQPAVVSYDVGYWVANGPGSKWISPSVDTSGISDALYSYETTIDLSGLDAATARVAGSWSVDDAGWVFLNGQLVAELPFGWMFQQLYGLQVAPNAPSYTADHDFVLTSGFLPGKNTLTVLAWNGGGGPT